MTEPEPPPGLPLPEAAASVLMVRDGEVALEIFMVRRNERSNVLGGAWVFPGGKVDLADADAALHRQHLDLPTPMLRHRLGETDLTDAAAGALYVAAAREVFEECGVLFAQEGAAAVAAQAPREGDFGALLHAHTLRLSADTLRPWSRWVTPPNGMFIRNRRFDTRFFIAALPPGQQARHDACEAVDGRWFTARAALTQYWEGQLMLAPPQLMSLCHVGTYADTATLLAAAAARPPYCVRPEVLEIEGGRALAYPGDPQHPAPERVMPGPLRLLQRGARMEPPGGFAEFCA